jgi:Domain of Unknown Function (DUF1206)
MAGARPRTDPQGPSDEAQRRAESSTTLDQLARVGMLTYGVAHLAVAWLVVRLAFGDRSGAASGSGALHQFATTQVGRVTLYAVAGGFLALALWQALEACFGYRRRVRRRRLGLRLLSAAKVVIFLVVVANAGRLAAGASGGGGTDGLTARVMRWPAGPWLVGAGGIAIVVVAFFLARFGWVENFRDTMTRRGTRGPVGQLYVWLGKVGYLTRGLALAMVGALFTWAALTGDARRSGGLDQVLNDLLGTPVGTPAACLLAAGLASYGLFCGAAARHLDR